MAALPGYLGTIVHRPPPSGPREFTRVFRFDSLANLRGFEESGLRHRALIEVADMTWVIMPRLTRALARWIYAAVRATA